MKTARRDNNGVWGSEKVVGCFDPDNEKKVFHFVENVQHDCNLEEPLYSVGSVSSFGLNKSSCNNVSVSPVLALSVVSSNLTLPDNSVCSFP